MFEEKEKTVQPTDEIASFTLHIVQRMKWGKKRYEYWAIWPYIWNSSYEATTDICEQWTAWIVDREEKVCALCIVYTPKIRREITTSNLILRAFQPILFPWTRKLPSFFFYISHRFFASAYAFAHFYTDFILVVSVRTPNTLQSGSMVGGVRAFRRQNRYMWMLLFFVSVYFFFFFHLNTYFVVSFILVLFYFRILFVYLNEYVFSTYNMVFMHIEIFRSFIWEVNEIENCWKCIRNTKLKLLVVGEFWNNI